MGIEVRLNTTATAIIDDGITVRGTEDDRVAARTIRDR